MPKVKFKANVSFPHIVKAVGLTGTEIKTAYKAGDVAELPDELIKELQEKAGKDALEVMKKAKDPPDKPRRGAGGKK
jgi:hypothetical protein